VSSTTVDATPPRGPARVNKRLVVCSDGTWNTPDQAENGKRCPTNVTKMARAVAGADVNGVVQVVFYDHGVGTGGLLDRWTGGAFGRGLERNVEDNYRFLVHNFEPGDEIWFFGFSRGAFTVRSTAGMIRKSGLLRRECADKIPEAYELYRSRDLLPDCEEAREFRRTYARETRIRFIGVWDTVGARGIPFSPLRWLTKRRYEFHDVQLSRSVDGAFHAIAIDEQRKPFAPALWTTLPSESQRVEQRWFAGVHSNVGGGYPDAGLSDLAFLWMKDRAQEFGLAFDEAYVRSHVAPDALGQMRNSFSLPYRLLGRYVRPIGLQEYGYEAVHESSLQRTSLPEYAPSNLMDYLRRSHPGGGERHRTDRADPADAQVPATE
jgi:uncharacterized protein (DUF2235 family)